MFKEKIPIVDNVTFIAREFEVPFIDYPMHVHPEYELILISNINGTRYVGDHREEVSGRDLVLLGPNIPHQWKCGLTCGNATRQQTIQINKNFLGKDFIQRDETQKIKNLLDRAKRGIAFYGDILFKMEKSFGNLMHTKGFEGLLLLLKMMHQLSETTKFKILSSTTYADVQAGSFHDQGDDIFRLLLNRFREQLSLASVANYYKMSESAFAHYIRKKTGKRFSDLLNEIRIGYACKLLVNSNKNISEIAFECGYNNISYFNRKFRELKNLSPKSFKKEYQKNEA